jgi:hypothetical protein
MYDYLIKDLHCLDCGTINPTTAYTNLQTHIRGGGADGSELTVGTSLAPVYITTEHLVRAGHALITPPTAADSIRLLDIWICPMCNTEQWAMIGRRIHGAQARQRGDSASVACVANPSTSHDTASIARTLQHPM